MERKLREIYDYMKLMGTIPLDDESTKFLVDNSVMRTWLIENKDKIKLLANQGNDYAIIVSDFWSSLDMVTFENRLKELAQYIKMYETIPNDKTFFNSRDKMKKWLREHTEEIYECVNNGSNNAFVVAKYWEKINSSEKFNNRLKEVVDYWKKNGVLPDKSSDVWFSDGKAKIGYWLNNCNDKIIDAAGYNNIYAIEILNVKEIVFNNKLKEICNYYEKEGILPLNNTDLCFSNESVSMISWLYVNEEKIRKEAYSGNKLAATIINALTETKEQKFNMKLREVLNYIRQSKEKRQKESEGLFSDGTKIRPWLYNNKLKLCKAATDNNELAIEIVNYIYSNDKLSFNDKLMEIVKYIRINGALPANNFFGRFSDGKTIMSIWLNNNKKLIEEAANNDNKYAILILNYNKLAIFKKRLKELYHYLEFNNALPHKNSDDKFIDGTIMFDWLSNNMVNIYKLAKNGSMEAVLILQEISRKNPLIIEEISKKYDIKEKKRK